MKAINGAPDVSTLGGRIQAVREMRGLTQTQLAELAKLTQPSMSAIESNATKEVTAIRLGRIARALRTTWEFLLFDEDYGVELDDAQSEAELIAIYRGLPPSAQQAVLRDARLIYEALQPTEADRKRFNESISLNPNAVARKKRA